MTAGEKAALPVRRVRHDKILLYGDSITEMSSDILNHSFGITPALQHHYFRKLAVVARGYGGYTSEHLRYTLPPTLEAETAAGETVRLLVLEIGTNDISTNNATLTPLPRFAENMRWIVDTARASGVERVVVVGPAPCDETLRPDMTDRSMKRTREYAAAAKEVAKECEVPFLDLYQAFLEKAGWKEGQPVPGEKGSGAEGNLAALLSDGVHFTGEGYRVWYETLLAMVRDEFPELRTEVLATVLPHIYDVDNGNLPETLWQEVYPKPPL